MADPRYYVKLDVGYFDNPKTSELLEDHPRALILHLRAIAYCRQHLTDGDFPIRQVVRLACGSHCGSQCDGQCDFCMGVQCGLFDRVDERIGRVHDYLKHQDSAEDILRRKTAAKRGAAARWDAKGNADRIATGSAKGNAGSNAKERRGEERREDSCSSDDERDTTPDPFTDWWSHYPRKVGKGQAVKAYRAALKKTDANTLLEAIKAQAPKLTERGTEFCPYPATWLNGERWADETDTTEEADPWAHLPTVDQLVAERGF